MGLQNENIIVAFECDGCLIHQVGEKADTPRYDIIELFMKFYYLGCNMVVWSGGGIDHAEMVVRKLGLEARVIEKGSIKPHLVFDDLKTKMGLVDIQV